MKNGKPVAEATESDESKKRSAEIVDLESSSDPKKQKVDSSGESSGKKGEVAGESAVAETARSPSQLAVEEKMKKKASLQATLKITSDPLTRSVALEARKPAHTSTGLRDRPTIP